jgi:hypothetical protein
VQASLAETVVDLLLGAAGAAAYLLVAAMIAYRKLPGHEMTESAITLREGGLTSDWSGRGLSLRSTLERNERT